MPQNLPFWDWDKSATAVCALIRNKKAIFKVVLKTKNESFFIERWVQHYLQILGADAQLIIFDHYSTDPAVLATYARYADNLVIIRFSGGVDWLHSIAIYHELYKALWDSCKYYAFLDTDEFLYLSTGSKLLTGQAIYSFLERHADVPFFPAVWLNNAFWREDSFEFEATAEQLREHALWGKPLVNSQLLGRNLTSVCGHNLHVPAGLCQESPLCFVLLHFKRLSPQQRLKVNMEKLVNFGVVASTADVAAVCAIPAVSAPLNYRRYVLEVQEIDKDDFTPEQENLPESGYLQMDKQGLLSFTTPEAGQFFKAHLNAKSLFINLLGLSPEQIMQNPQDMLWKLVDEKAYKQVFTRE